MENIGLGHNSTIYNTNHQTYSTFSKTLSIEMVVELWKLPSFTFYFYFFARFFMYCVLPRRLDLTTFVGTGSNRSLSSAMSLQKAESLSNCW